MKRREFLNLLGAGSLSASFFPRLLCSPAQAAAKPLILVTVQAQGGWDTAFMFSPKPAPISPYRMDAVRSLGPFTIAPASESLYEFVEAYGDRLTVIQGIDSRTNNHGDGERYLTSGKLTDGYPHIGALWAAIGGQGMELAFASRYGYQNTGNLVPITPILRPGALTSLVSGQESSASEQALVRQALGERLQRVNERDVRRLPGDGRRFAEFRGLRQMESNLTKLPALIKELSDRLPNPTNNDTINNVIRSAVAYCAADLTIALNIGISSGAGGLFDSHDNHDRAHPLVLDFAFDAIRYFMEGATYFGFADRVVLLVVSDFGRTPTYTDGNGTGKGHWPIGAAMVMGPGIPQQVIGAIDNQSNGVRVNPKTLRLDDAGVALGPEHLQMAIRRLLGISDHELCRAFPFALPELPLLG